MKTRNFFYVALAFMALSCAKEIAPEGAAPEKDFEYVAKSFTAGIDVVEDVNGPESKTSLVNGYQVEWKKNDAVAVFDNVSNAVNVYTATEGGSVTTLEGEVPSGSTEFLAIYPDRGKDDKGNDRLTKSGDVISGCYIAQTQRPPVGTFYATCGYMIAKSDAVDNMQFLNLTSMIKFTLGEDMTDVKSLTLVGNNNEPLSGTFNVDWNNGSPKIILVSSDSYVTIAKSNGEALAPGDYYFTILPAELKNGFTVILSKTDGTQVAKKTTKDMSALGQCNRILPMKALAKTDYDPHMNYFVKYNDGFDVALSSYTINKSSHGNATYMTDSKSTTEIRAVTGVYFVAPGCENVKLGGGSARTKLVVAGADAAIRSDIAVTSAQNIASDSDATTKNECLVLANLNCTMGDFNFIRVNVEQYGAIVINNCALNAIKKGLMNMDASSASSPEVALDLDLLEISDSEIGIDYTGQAWMVMQRGSISTCAKFTATNNVFYVCGGEEKGVTQFLLMHANNSGKGFNFNEVICNNNTFVDTPITGNAISALSADSHTTNGNLFVNILYKNVNENNGAIAGYATPPSHGEIINNYYYSEALNIKGNLFKLNPGGTASDWDGRKGSPVLLAADPLSSIWKPAEGTFGAYSFSVASGTAPAYNKIGAQRADMIPVTADLDSPAAGYSSVDLGAF